MSQPQQLKKTEPSPVTAFGAKVIDISNFVYQPNFPRCAMKQLIQMDNKVGKFIKVSVDEQTFTFHDHKTNQKHICNIIQVMMAYGKNKALANAHLTLALCNHLNRYISDTSYYLI